MISPQEIKAQAIKWWKPFLQSHLRNEPFFPKTIDRIGKITSSAIREKITELQTQLNELYANSKEKLGFGYVINKADVNFRRTGSHTLPQSITFETAEDYIEFIGKKKDWNVFLKNSSLIHHQISQLTEWVVINPLLVVENDKKWEDLLKVCKYFLANPQPDLYIRQLPIDLHTKFIEQNEALLKSLLDYLIPEHIKDATEKQLSKRYHLRFDEPTMRIRILDNRLLIDNLSDVGLPLSEFRKLSIECSNILLTENKMNFLALPELLSTIAIWSGGGFMISHLKNTDWLKMKNIFYWGDLDAHGFLILHQMRSYFPQTKAIMMNMNTFELFKGEGLVSGEKINSENLSTLTETELEMFQFLKTNNYRLEQEKIRQEYVDGVLRSVVGGECHH
ncbi:MAG: hypothetical protein IPK31_13595 [Chitinophagaceae bacterium]|nr:hypothetical protein [Chitinophagaceae bacterium]